MADSAVAWRKHLSSNVPVAGGGWMWSIVEKLIYSGEHAKKSPREPQNVSQMILIVTSVMTRLLLVARVITGCASDQVPPSPKA